MRDGQWGKKIYFVEMRFLNYESRCTLYKKYFWVWNTSKLCTKTLVKICSNFVL